MLDRTNHNALHEARFGIGGNNPPDMIALAQGTMTAVGRFLADHPVIQDEIEAKEAKLLKDRADDAVKDMEAERDGLVRPLNEKVAAINGRYRPVRDPLEKIIKELRAQQAGQMLGITRWLGGANADGGDTGVHTMEQQIQPSGAEAFAVQYGA